MSNGDRDGLIYIMEHALYRGISCCIGHVKFDVLARVEFPQPGARAKVDKCAGGGMRRQLVIEHMQANIVMTKHSG